MKWGLTPAWQALRREWMLYHMGDQRFRFMFDAPPENEWVSVDCETTGLNVGRDEIISIGAVRIVGDRILTSRVHRLREQDVAQGLDPDEAIKQLLHFIGSRPLVGYYLEFDVAMLNKVIFPILGMGLPQPKFEISAMYFEYKNRRLAPHMQSVTNIDLRFATLMDDLGLPLRDAHDAVNDAVMAAMAFTKLRHLNRLA
jgi:DNA polymerase-3 subunit epsilon